MDKAEYCAPFIRRFGPHITATGEACNCAAGPDGSDAPLPRSQRMKLGSKSGHESGGPSTSANRELSELRNPPKYTQVRGHSLLDNYGYLHEQRKQAEKWEREKGKNHG